MNPIPTAEAKPDQPTQNTLAIMGATAAIIFACFKLFTDKK